MFKTENFERQPSPSNTVSLTGLFCSVRNFSVIVCAECLNLRTLLSWTSWFSLGLLWRRSSKHSWKKTISGFCSFMYSIILSFLSSQLPLYRQRFKDKIEIPSLDYPRHEWYGITSSLETEFLIIFFEYKLRLKRRSIREKIKFLPLVITLGCSTYLNFYSFIKV